MKHATLDSYVGPCCLGGLGNTLLEVGVWESGLKDQYSSEKSGGIVLFQGGIRKDWERIGLVGQPVPWI